MCGAVLAGQAKEGIGNLDGSLHKPSLPYLGVRKHFAILSKAHDDRGTMAAASAEPLAPQGEIPDPLWTGIALGIYVVLISVSGSAIVFRNELYKSLFPPPKIVAISGPRLSKDALKKAVKQAWPKYSVSYIFEAKRPDEATEVWIGKDSEAHPKTKGRLINPFTGEDLGPSRPRFSRRDGVAHGSPHQSAGGRKRQGGERRARDRHGRHQPQRARDLVARNGPRQTQPENRFQSQLEAAELGSAQRDRALDVRVRFHLGRYGRLRGVPEAIPGGGQPLLAARTLQAAIERSKNPRQRA